ncbi:hypothetical protein CRN58_17440, partial [Vibrio vulnificus]
TISTQWLELILIFSGTVTVQLVAVCSYNDLKLEAYQRNGAIMGCCNNEKGCEARKTARRIPWFAVTIGVLALLVIFNWQ